MAFDVPEGVKEATQFALKAAEHLTKMDAGAIAALLKLASKIDYLMANDGMSEDGKFDNVSIPTYLKYCESLGLTPAGRARPNFGGQKPESKQASGLTGLQGGVAGGRRG